jgi:hypothetical protein
LGILALALDEPLADFFAFTVDFDVAGFAPDFAVLEANWGLTLDGTAFLTTFLAVDLPIDLVDFADALACAVATLGEVDLAFGVEAAGFLEAVAFAEAVFLATAFTAFFTDFFTGFLPVEDALEGFAEVVVGDGFGLLAAGLVVVAVATGVSAFTVLTDVALLTALMALVFATGDLASDLVGLLAG